MKTMIVLLSKMWSLALIAIVSVSCTNQDETLLPAPTTKAKEITALATRYGIDVKIKDNQKAEELSLEKLEEVLSDLKAFKESMPYTKVSTVEDAVSTLSGTNNNRAVTFEHTQAMDDLDPVLFANYKSDMVLHTTCAATYANSAYSISDLQTYPVCSHSFTSSVLGVSLFGNSAANGINLTIVYYDAASIQVWIFANVVYNATISSNGQCTFSYTLTGNIEAVV